MRLGMFSLIGPLFVLLAAAAPAAAQSDESVRALAESYWQARLEQAPTWATYIGDYRYNDRLDDLSDEARRRWGDTLKQLSGTLNRINAGRLSSEDRLNRELLRFELQSKLMRLACNEHLTPLNPLNGPQVRFPLIVDSQPFRNYADYLAYEKRLRAFPRQVSQIIENLRFGAAAGVTSPRVLVEKATPQIRTHLVRDVTRSVFYTTPATKASVLSEDRRGEVLAQIAGAIRSDVIPAYLRLLAYIEDEYLPLCRRTVGLSALPNGDKLYEAKVFLSLTARISVDDIHNTGLSEMQRIREAMDVVQKEIGFKGTVGEFIDHMRTDPRYRIKSREDLLLRCETVLERAKPLLPELFTRLPKADIVLKEIESFRSASSPMGYYGLPPEDGSRPAYYYVNTYAPKQRKVFSVEVLTYHESVPGHHLQMALAQETSNLPAFRRYARFSAHEEGWALYAEGLGEELGGYLGPVPRFGRLNFDMWRACRLVVDTGLHAKGWSRSQAIDYLLHNTAFSRREIEREVDRYIAWPGQALAYKIGELKIRELRREAERTLGDRFDLRAFHDELLRGGAMPLDILMRRMREWIKTR